MFSMARSFFSPRLRVPASPCRSSLLLIRGDFVRTFGVAVEVGLDLARQFRRGLRLLLDRDGRIVGKLTAQLFLGLFDLQAILDLGQDLLAVRQPAVVE